jgi:hypothetical protein
VELDMSGKMDGAADAIMLVPEITDNGALLHLNLANNRLNDGGRGMDHIGPAVASSNSITSLDIASSCVGWNGGVEKVVQMLTDNGALTKIDLSRNSIPSDQEGRLQRICEAGGTELAM